MAQFMKIQIRLILSGDEILTIDVENEETFEDFQNKCIQMYGIHLDKNYFNFNSNEIGIDNHTNLTEYLNSFNTSDADDATDILVYEITLPDEYVHMNLPVKTETPIVDMNINSQQFGSFIDINTENEVDGPIHTLQDNIFENSYNILSNTKNSTDSVINLLESSHYISDKTVEGNSHASDHDSSSENKTDQLKLYNYMDIESKLREIHESTEEIITDFCRLCARTLKEQKKIFINTENENLTDNINLFLPIKVSSTDKLPQQICESCENHIENFSSFVERVKEADKVLQLKFKTEINKLHFNEQEKNIVKFESNEIGEKLEYTLTEDHLKCRFCQQILLDVDMSIKHSTEFHKNRNGLFICSLCEMGYTQFKLLEEHVEIKHKKQLENRNLNFKCNICSKRYSTLTNLQKHTCLKPKTPQISLHCEICNQCFPSKVRLNFHRQFHLNNARKFFCTECRITFKNENTYFDHVNFLHDPEQIFVCDICEKTFNLRSAYTNHKKVHFGEKNYKCEVCQKSFLTKQTLQEHEVSHMETKPHQCHLCGKNLSRISRLRRHMLTHKSQPEVKEINFCNVCKQCFENNEMAIQHKEEEHSLNDCIEIICIDRVFRCEFCEKCFSETTALNLHRFDHQGLTPYTCHICKAKFTTYSRCISHKTTHGIFTEEGNKDNFPVDKHFLCQHCGKSYLQWNYLSLHYKLKHFNKLPFKCINCNIEFASALTLNNHRKTVHGEEIKVKSEETLLCVDCGKRFSSVKLLQIHQVTQHNTKYGKDFTCCKCNKIFASQMSLDTHIRTHNKEYKCKLCSKSFAQIGSLNNHLKLHKTPHTGCLYCGRKYTTIQECAEHEKLHIKHKHICEVCEEPFNTKKQLSEHHEVHTEKPYVCKICGLAFRRGYTLTNHMNRHIKAKHSGSFVLMVDMKEELEQEEKNKNKNIPTPTVTKKENNLVPMEKDLENELAANYIDMGNGNYLKIQGNTINIDGSDYILLNENGDNDNQNQQFQMVIDENSVENDLPQVENLSSTIMLVDDNNQILLNENQNDQQFFLTDDNVTTKPNTTYIIGNHILPDETNF